jgi:DUF1680 family protein
MAVHPNVAACRGKVALQRGPLVYGFEGVDHGGDLRIEFGADPEFSSAHEAGLLGGVTVIRGRAANGRRVMAVPFYTLANRGNSVQEVWVGQTGVKGPEDWWLGRLYRPLMEP